MVFKIFPVVAADQYAERKRRHPTSCTSVHRPARLVNGSWPHPLSTVVHIARPGDLFKERHKIIHTTIS